LFCDESSKQIVRMLLDECEKAGVHIEVECTIENVAHTPQGFALTTTKGAVAAKSLVVASGGLSIPKMGATGFGYALARQLGHTVHPTRAGLVPLTLSGTHLESYADLSGVALPVESACNGQHFRGGMLITHRGLSGPAILQISSYWQPGDDLRLNLLPDLDVLAHLETQQRERPGAEFRTVLAEVLPKRFAQRLCERWFGSRPLRQYPITALRDVAAQLAHWPIVASGTEGYRTAEVTLGGVNVDELSSTTMESRLVPGLYFIGEVVDVTGHLGGFNFQWAWASGHAAGQVV
jgi:predicted Rossmann fold flavoprotein